MSKYLKKILNKDSKDNKQQEKNDIFYEKDNKGTRHETAEMAANYWKTSPKVAFVLYTFTNDGDARHALLELPCIRVAKDNDKLICTENLIFGYYYTEGENYEAVIGGEKLSSELWKQAKASFIKYNGKPGKRGELEPHIAPRKKEKYEHPKMGEVTFIRDDKQIKMGETYVHHIYKGPSAAAAKKFLEEHPVKQKSHYIVVETPEGNYCRDIHGIYSE